MIFWMTDWWNALQSLEQVFWGIAIVSSVLFVIQFGLSLLGLDFESDVDVETGSTDFAVDPSFALFSVRSFIAFATFFGWAGVLALNSGYAKTMVIVWALIAGFSAMMLVAYLMYFFSTLSQEGNANVQDLLFENGSVYLTIPAHRKGAGKVHVTLASSLREMNAVTEGEELASGKNVKIVEIIEDNVLVVEPIEIFETEVSQT